MDFTPPNLLDRIINRAFGMLLRAGLGLRHNYLLEVRGRKSGKVYSTPVNVLDYDGKQYLVAPRGYTHWVRNVEAGSGAVLIKGRRREAIKLQPVAAQAKPEILKTYLDRFRPTVQRYFPIPAGSPVGSFAPLAERYPVFQLTR